MSPHVALEPRRILGALRRLRRPGPDTLLVIGLAAVLCAIAAEAEGGLRLGPTTTVEIALLLGAGGLIAGTVLVGSRREPVWGLGTICAFLALAALTGLSITWAANPADAWEEFSRTLAYAATFAAAVAFARMGPRSWSAALGAVTLAAVALSAYAIATRVFPGRFSAEEIYARLREPFGYWNAVGVTAAMGVPGCLWLGARRAGHRALNALAYPALALLLVTMLLSYSRGALLAAGIGAAFWFAFVPLRLRGAAVLLTSGAAAALVAVWTFGQEALTTNHVALGLRRSAGHELGLLVVSMLVLLLLTGLAISFWATARPPSAQARRRAGTTLALMLALTPFIAMGGLALSSRGLGGSISNAWSTVTDPHSTLPPNAPGRLTEVGSVRARYWNDALKIFKDEPLTGVGAGGYATVRARYRSDTLEVRHAHGYLLQTLSDLGLLGLVASLGLLAAWIGAAARATGLRVRRREPDPGFSPERIALVSLVAVVVVYGAHSTVDWTWFVPADTAMALLAAGVVAGRGPLRAAAAATAPEPDPPPPAGESLPDRLRAGARERPRALVAAGITILALAAAWTTWQPQRSASAGQDALAALERSDIVGARADVQRARDRDPLSVDPLFESAVIERSAGQIANASAALEAARRLQPRNPVPWLRLAELELSQPGRERDALVAASHAVHLDPRSSEAIDVFLSALRQSPAP